MHTESRPKPSFCMLNAKVVLCPLHGWRKESGVPGTHLGISGGMKRYHRKEESIHACMHVYFLYIIACFLCIIACMHVYICLHVYIHVCMHVGLGLCMHVCRPMCMCVYVCMYVCMYVTMYTM